MFNSLIHFTMRVHTDTTVDASVTGGGRNETLGLMLAGTGAGVGAGYIALSAIHTAVAAPVLTLACVGTSGALGVAGYAAFDGSLGQVATNLSFWKKDEDADKPAVTVKAEPVPASAA